MRCRKAGGRADIATKLLANGHGFLPPETSLASPAFLSRREKKSDESTDVFRSFPDPSQDELEAANSRCVGKNLKRSRRWLEDPCIVDERDHASA